jgi:uncharacterized DUF497 family protein
MGTHPVSSGTSSKAESKPPASQGVSFEEARTAIADEQAIVIDDPDSAR